METKINSTTLELSREVKQKITKEQLLKQKEMLEKNLTEVNRLLSILA